MTDTEDGKNKVMTKKDVYNLFAEFLSWDRTPKIGIEGEKIGLMVRTGKPTTYLGSSGYLAVLGKLYEELGWEITKQEGKFILQMKRGNETVDLESDGRIELAGSPHESIHDLAREFRIHQGEISEIADVFGIGWLGIGYHPVSKNEEIENVPQARKELLANFFENIKEKTGNDFPLAWYKKTAGIHVSMDYFSEEDIARKTKIFTKLAPILNAIFANSPFSRGEFTG
jgi:glutamate--cysteine ligase